MPLREYVAPLATIELTISRVIPLFSLDIRVGGVHDQGLIMARRLRTGSHGDAAQGRQGSGRQARRHAARRGSRHLTADGNTACPMVGGERVGAGARRQRRDPNGRFPGFGHRSRDHPDARGGLGQGGDGRHRRPGHGGRWGYVAHHPLQLPDLLPVLLDDGVAEGPGRAAPQEQQQRHHGLTPQPVAAPVPARERPAATTAGPTAVAAHEFVGRHVRGLRGR